MLGWTYEVFVRAATLSFRSFSILRRFVARPSTGVSGRDVAAVLRSGVLREDGVRISESSAPV